MDLHSRTEPTCSAIFSSATQQLPPYPRLMAVAAAAEALARQLYPQPPARKARHMDRLRHALEPLPGGADQRWIKKNMEGLYQPDFRELLEILGDAAGRRFTWTLEHHFGSDWPKLIAVARNHYAHSGRRKHEFLNRGLQLMAECLTLLLRLCLFRSLGLSEEQMSSVIQHDPQWRDIAYTELVELREDP